MTKRFIILAIAITAIIVVIGFIALQFSGMDGDSSSNRPKVDTGITVGKTLPQFVLTALDGNTVKIGDSGQIIVLNFWATWCPPCRQEMPELNNFAQKYGSKVMLYTVNVQESNDKVAGFISQNKYNLNVLLDKDGEVSKTFRINAIPTTIIADRQGIIKYRKSGPVTLAELEGVLNGL